MTDEDKKTGPRACTTCAKAKARCIPCENPSKCERCDRLRKPCSRQIPAPPRPRRARKQTRVAVLEQRLENLTAQIREANVAEENTATDASTHSSRSTPVSLPNTKRGNFSHLFPTSILDPVGPVAVARDDKMDKTADVRASPGVSAKIGGASWPDVNESELLLDEYRHKMMPVFPFVMIPASTKSAQLRQERPLLWKAIMLEVCGLDGQRQFGLGKSLLQELSEALLTIPKKSLDVLQALLLYIAWYNCALSSFQITNLLGLARSACLSLGISDSQVGRRCSGDSLWCLERLRAFAGTYYLTTSIFTTSKRPEAFMNTAYIDMICHAMEEKAEYSTDRLLVYLIKVQQLAQTVSYTLNAYNTNFQTAHLSVLPLTMAIANLKSQIDIFKDSIPGDLREHVGLAAHVHVVEILLYEVALQEAHAVMGNLQSMERLEVLWSLLGALKSFLAMRFEKSMAEWPRFPCISSVDFTYAFLTALKLTTLHLPGWDLSVVRKDLALELLVERQIEDMETLVHCRTQRRSRDSATDSQTTEEDPFKRMITMLRGVATVLQAMPEPASIPTSPIQIPTPPSVDNQSFDFGASTSTPEAWQSLLSEGGYNINDWIYENLHS